MSCESSLYSCDWFGNLCSTFGPDSLHVHLKPPGEVTPLNIDVWVDALLYYSDPRAYWVIDGLKNGFKVGYTGGNLISASQNMPSALSHAEVVDNHILKELKRDYCRAFFLTTNS